MVKLIKNLVSERTAKKKKKKMVQVSLFFSSLQNTNFK